MALSSIPLATLPPRAPTPPPLTLIALLDVIVMVPIFLAAAVAVAVVVVVDVVIVKRFLGLIYEAGQAAYSAAQRRDSVQSLLLPHTRQTALLAVMGVRL